MNEQNNILLFDESLIIKHFCKECSLEEEATLLLWIDASAENLETYLKMKQLWALRQVNHYVSDLEMKRALAKLNGKIQANEQRRRRATIRRISRYAAVAVVLLGGLLLYLVTTKPTAEQWITATTTGNEAVRIVTLPDSSKVWLNENTSLSYPETFTQRSVKISGEAFFEVKPDAARPFTVETSIIQVRVLGTSFDVKDRPDEALILTTLEEGKIALYDGDVLLASLLPGQQAMYDHKSRQACLKNVKTDLYTSWRNGLVMFDKAYLADILEGIEDAYHVRIVYNSEKALNKQYNFVFRKNQPVETVLEMLQFVAPIKYKINGNEIYVNEK